MNWSGKKFKALISTETHLVYSITGISHTIPATLAAFLKSGPWPEEFLSNTLRAAHWIRVKSLLMGIY